MATTTNSLNNSANFFTSDTGFTATTGAITATSGDVVITAGQLILGAHWARMDNCQSLRQQDTLAWGNSYFNWRHHRLYSWS